MGSRLVWRLVALCFVVAAFAATAPSAFARVTYIVVDHATGAVVAEDGADAVNYPASLAKMMTLYLVFEAIEQRRLRLDDRLTVSTNAARMPASRLGLRAGDSIAVEVAIQALAIKSANDVAVVMAEVLGGTERRFAELMTSRAKDLGLDRTSFRNASGLPDAAQRTTARDMVTLARSLLRDFPQYYSYFSLPSFSWNGRTYRSHNQLMSSYPGMDGLKTGYIRASGFNLASSAVRDGRRLVAVVLGGKTAKRRNATMATVLDRAFATLAKTAQMVALTPKPRPSRSFGIQVGAFSRAAVAQGAARRASLEAPHILASAHVDVSLLAAERPLYRSRLIGLTRTEADAACLVLSDRGLDCLVVQPTDAVEFVVN